ncbi:MAG: endonuclease MutS2 [Peptostreptococcaceae bacterium]|nr:endonuclease MutS2 [Peptostreptococcaceae bacterium]
MNKKAIKVLEYEKITNLLYEQAGSTMTQEVIKKLRPMKNLRMINDALTETTEAVTVIVNKGAIPVGNFYDIEGLLNLSRKGGSLSMRQLLMIHYNLLVAKQVKTFLKNDLPELKIIDGIVELIVPLPNLDKDIDRCIISEDEMADNASPELRNIRRAILRKNDAIRVKLNQMINSSSTKTYLQDSLITLRDGRYVIPVKQEHKNVVPGMVHDQSSSGATLFIEPQAVVELNNELRQLEIAEKAEIERILKGLTDRVSEHYYEISNNQNLLVQIDLINAKGKLSVLMEGERPTVNDTGFINIVQGRHPLIDKKTVVPIDVYLGKDFKTLVVTGPNTGGKTVTLKTIGLFALMTQTGLHIPAAGTSEMPVFQEVFADIGDEQSIEQSLSTFSSHMTNITYIVSKADKNSLVLFDELGAGTDPIEGAALGIAILEELRHRGVYIVATTHYTELKKYALSNDGVDNASMEFNIETLSPTYKLRIGLPGKSNAFEISRKLGLDENIINRANSLIEGTDLEFEDVISAIERDKKLAEAEKDEAIMLKIALQKKEELADKLLREAELKKKQILENAKEEARLTIKEAKETSEEVRKELKKVKSTENFAERNRIFEESNKKLKTSEKKYSATLVREEETNVTSPEEIKVGMRVKVLSINQNGDVISLPDSRNEVKVKIGIMKMSVPTSDIRTIIEGKSQKKARQKVSSYGNIYKSKSMNVSPSVTVRGQNLDDALMDVEKYLDDAYLAGLNDVTIIHGVGEGVLKEGIRIALKRNKHVKSVRAGKYNEGGEGVTMVKLKEN